LPESNLLNYVLLKKKRENDWNLKPEGSATLLNMIDVFGD
jgi:hypothetical protein